MITVNNREYDWTQTMTVQELLDKLNYTYSEIILKINGEHIPKKDYNSTYVKNGDNVLALHMFGGG